MTNIREFILRCLIILSSTPDDQVAYLAQIGDSSCVDELALEFDHVFSMSEQAIRKKHLSQQEYDILDQINNKLEEMSGEHNAHLWSQQALYDCNEWEQVRVMAKECLRVLEGKKIS